VGGSMSISFDMLDEQSWIQSEMGTRESKEQVRCDQVEATATARAQRRCPILVFATVGDVPHIPRAARVVQAVYTPCIIHGQLYDLPIYSAL